MFRILRELKRFHGAFQYTASSEELQTCGPICKLQSLEAGRGGAIAALLTCPAASAHVTQYCAPNLGYDITLDEELN